MEEDTLQVSLRTRARFLLLLVLCVLALLVCAYLLVSTYSTNHHHGLRVAYLNIGQGDSIFIESPTGRQVLIDGGPDRSVLRELSKQMGFFDRSIDMVLMTHEDKDHIGGIPSVLTRYAVGTVLRTENQGESGPAKLIDTLEVQEGAKIIYARRGMSFDLGGGALLEVLFPDKDPTHMEPNYSSIVAKVTYGDASFLFNGDSPIAVEQYIDALNCKGLESDVLKAGHHGSRTSTSNEYLDCVKPRYAVISSGKNNRYGHPHKETLEHLAAHNIIVLNTAESGTIVFESDGGEPVRVP